MRQSGEFQTFSEKLRREIAIETGIIERLYNLDRGITRLLIEQGINEALIPHGATDRPVKQVVSLIKDQESAIEGLFDFVGGQRMLSTTQERCKQVENFASILFDIASRRFQEVTNEIKSSLQNFVEDFNVFTVGAAAGDPRSYYHRYQVVETAKKLEYFANLRSYHTWLQLIINAETSTTLLLSFHVLGHEYQGLLVCTACAYHRDKDDSSNEGERNMSSVISDIQPLIDSPFQFSYADEETSLVKQFQKWLEDVILTGLEYWNKSI
ncbi:MAG: hypothetical protein MUF49_17400 [Oculatellaceae cyanobacterium Prado106]|nr:hypothetical protein [Oculatellaceae cyanobacterium Prado106]